MYGYSPATGAVQAMSAGYFAWDLMCTAGGVEVQGWGALVHAVAALVVSMLGFVGFSLSLSLLPGVLREGNDKGKGADVWVWRM